MILVRANWKTCVWILLLLLLLLILLLLLLLVLFLLRLLFLLLLLLLLTLQPCVGFGRVHQIIPGFSVFNEVDPVSQS
jgi:hypothetical protein